MGSWPLKDSEVEWTTEHVAMSPRLLRGEKSDSSCPAAELEADLGQLPLQRGPAEIMWESKHFTTRSKPAHSSFHNALIPQEGETNPQQQFIRGVEDEQGLGALKS